MDLNLLTPDFYKNIKKIQKKEKFYFALAKNFAILGIVFVVLSFAPSVWYGLAVRVDDFSNALLFTVKDNQQAEVEMEKESRIPLEEWQPKHDPKNPFETRLEIPSIKVSTQINEATFESFEDALKKGVWRIPDFGTPFDRRLPTILAAHRFGYLDWSNLYRRYNSFYNLPKLKIGDTVEIIYKQRKYLYEVYSEGRGEEITDYSANLILYTCETLNSKVRIFKYARLLKI